MSWINKLGRDIKHLETSDRIFTKYELFSLVKVFKNLRFQERKISFEDSENEMENGKLDMFFSDKR